ncbi:MAG: nuclear transport factor 2 family protein [Chitinophagaceae bacterium]
MKTFYILLICLLATSQNLLAQSDKEKVWDLIVQLDNAIVKKDSGKLKQLLTEGFIGVVPSGEVFTKNNYISHHVKPGVGLMALTGHDINNATIRASPTIAIVNRRVHAKVKTLDGVENEFDVQRIEVCIKENGGWLIASGQGTRVSPGNPPKSPNPQ